MKKIDRSLRLLKAAFAVLFREKKLLLFPIIATGLALVVALFFIIPIALYPNGQPLLSSAHWSVLGHELAQNLTPSVAGHKPGGQTITPQSANPMFFSDAGWLAPICVLLYFTSMFLATFANVAFYHEIMQALNGQPVSIRRGFRFAATRWRAILMWSLFAGLVGYLLQAIEARLGFLGRIFTGLLGFMWSVACVFVIPTLIREEKTTDPLKLLRGSAGTLKRGWGELVIGFVGLEMASGLLLLAAISAGALLTLIVCLCFHWTAWLIVPVIIMEFVLLLPLLGLLGSVVNPVYRCALYIYATEGVVPGTFDKELLDSAWKVK
ncbi:MAG TPA: DUF6159 family protein [Verrucomicrobiae bacterium]|jgi:hypothetical protein